MRWLRKILGIPPAERREGISLGKNAKWLISGVYDQTIIFSNLNIIFPEPDYVMYFEGVVIAEDVKKYYIDHMIRTPANIRTGTLWPRPDTYHIQLTEQSIKSLISLSKKHASCELSDHFHIYKDNKIYLEWHDTWDKNPILCSGDISVDRLRSFCEQTGGILEEYPGA